MVIIAWLSVLVALLHSQVVVDQMVVIHISKMDQQH